MLRGKSGSAIRTKSGELPFATICTSDHSADLPVIQDPSTNAGFRAIAVYRGRNVIHI
jgi:hypothetical protein